MTDSEIKETMIDVDLNNDGFICVSEFKEHSRKVKQKKYERSSSREEGLMKYFRIIAQARIVKKWPPPFFIPIISLIQLTLFIIRRTYHDISWCVPLIFISQKRSEVWRYLTYCLVHADYEHIIVNLTLQIVVGLPLEMENKAFPVFCIYFLGVFCGSLGAYCFDPGQGLMGASGGVYSLIAAHLSTLVLNWVENRAVIINRVRSNEKAAHATDGKLLRILHLVAVILFGVIDIGYYLYRRHSEEGIGVSYVAHLIGTLTGLLVGIFALKDRYEEPWERHLKGASFSIFLLLLIVGIFWNILISPPTF